MTATKLESDHHHAVHKSSGAEGDMGHMASTYDLHNKLLFPLFLMRERTVREMTLDLASTKAGERVLEVGCGTGTLTLAATKRVGPSGEVHGIDIAPAMIAVARRKFERAGATADLQVGRIDQIPFPDSTFDVVLASFMIFHMTEATRRKGLSEVHRVLKPGGRFLAVDVDPPTKGYLWIMGRLILWLMLGSGEMLRHSVHELRPLLEEAGFAAVETGGTRYQVLGFARATR